VIDPRDTCDPLLDGAHAVLASPSGRELARRVIDAGGLPRLPDRGPRLLADFMPLALVELGFSHLSAPHPGTRARALALLRTEAPAALALLDAPADPEPEPEGAA
jgi:hypothetical protein